jgi:hypothetical protein
MKVAIAEMLNMDVKLSIEETIVAGCERLGIAPFVDAGRFKYKLGVMAATLEFEEGTQGGRTPWAVKGTIAQ